MLVFWLTKVLRTTVVLALAALIAAWPAWHWGGQPAVVALIWAAVVALLAAAGSLYVPSLAQFRRVSWLAQAYLAGSAILIFLMLPLGGLVYWLAKPVAMFWASITLFYFLLLIWQTRTAVREIRAFYASQR